MSNPSLQADAELDQQAELPEQTELGVRAQAEEIEALARWTYEDRRASMDPSVVIYDAKRRASRWANQQRRKYRKVAYTLGFLVDYSTHSIDASWKWLSAKHREIHHEPIGQSTFRRLVAELAEENLGLVEVTANWSNFDNEEYEGRQRWNTFRIHVGLAVQNGDKLVVHDWNAPLAEPQKRLLVDCQQCTEGLDPKRPDARFCSPKCRKAASRARGVTHNEHLGEHLPEHLGEHLPEHLGEHPNQLANTSRNTSSSSARSAEGDDEAAEDSGPKAASSSPSKSSTRRSSAQSRSASQPDRAARAQAEEVIRWLDDRLPSLGFVVGMGLRPVAECMAECKISAQDLTDAVEWHLSYDGYAGKFKVGGGSKDRAAVFISQLGVLAAEWIAFRKEHGVTSWAEYDDRQQAKHDAALAAGNKVFKLVNKAVHTNSEDEAKAFFTKAVKLCKVASEIEFDIDLAFSNTVLKAVMSALEHGSEDLFLTARAEHQYELARQEKKKQEHEERDRKQRIYDHKREHPDHYTIPCMRCNWCNGRGEPDRCRDKLHRSDIIPACLEASKADSAGREYAHSKRHPDHYAPCGRCTGCTADDPYCFGKVHVATDCPDFPAGHNQEDSE